MADSAQRLSFRYITQMLTSLCVCVVNGAECATNIPCFVFAIFSLPLYGRVCTHTIIFTTQAGKKNTNLHIHKQQMRTNDLCMGLCCDDIFLVYQMDSNFKNEMSAYAYHSSTVYRTKSKVIKLK